MCEILDVFDENQHRLGTASREDVHKKGLWHRTFHCWVVRGEGDSAQILFQKRSDSKKICPSLYDVSSAGHLLAGETVLEGVREIQEELGIQATPESLTFFRVHISETIERNGLVDREFHHIHFLYDSTPLSEYPFQEAELSGLLEVPIHAALTFFEGRSETLHGTGVSLENRTEHPVTAHLSDFVPREKTYYIMILTEALRFLAGKSLPESSERGL